MVLGGSFTIITGGWEGALGDLSLLDFGTITAQASVSRNDISFEVGYSIWNPSFSMDFGDSNVSVGFVVGQKWGFSVREGRKKFSLGSFEIEIEW